MLHPTVHQFRQAYLHPFRPHYEKHIVLVWLIAAALILVQALSSGSARMIAIGLGLGCIVASLPWAPRWAALMRLHRRMTDQSVTVLPLAETLKKLGGFSDKAFIGWGFEWGNHESQLAREIALTDPQKILADPNPDSPGQHWIHGVGSRDRPIYLPVADEHTLIVAMTRAGKTVLYRELIAQAVARGEAVIGLDPKGDPGLLAAFKEAAAAAGKPLLILHAGFPATSVRLDPLKNYDDPSELASRIAMQLGRTSKDQAFTAFCFMLLTNVINGMLLAGRRPSLVSIKRAIDGGLEELLVAAILAYCKRELEPGWESSLANFRRATLARRKRGPSTEDNEVLQLTPEEEAKACTAFYREHLSATRGSSEIEGLIATVEHPAEHRSKMITSLMPVLTKLTAGPLARLLSTDETDPGDKRVITDSARIVEQQQLVYVGLNSLGNEEVANSIGEILLADIAAVCGSRYNYAESRRNVSLFVDEAVEILNAGLIKILNKGGGAGFRVTLAAQTISDIETKMGGPAESEKLLGNINNFLFGRCTATPSQQFFTDRLPAVPIYTVAHTRTVTSPTDDPLQFSSAQGEQLHVEMESPIQPAILGCLPKLHFFGLIGSRFVKFRIPVLIPQSQESAKA